MALRVWLFPRKPVAVTQTPVKININSIDTEIGYDTVTPANTVSMPVRIMDSTGADIVSGGEVKVNDSDANSSLTSILGDLSDIKSRVFITGKEAHAMDLAVNTVTSTPAAVYTLTNDAKKVKYVNNSGFYLLFSIASSTFIVAAGASGESEIDAVSTDTVDVSSLGKAALAGLDGSTADSGVCILNFEG